MREVVLLELPVRLINRRVASKRMRRVTEISDNDLDPYRDLKQVKYSRDSETFIAEGRFVVERLLESSFEVESVLVSSERFGELPCLDSLKAPVLLVSSDVCEQLVGFPFHRGIMACGKRKKCHRVPAALAVDRSLLVCCPEPALAENLGAIIRTSAALGAGAVLTGNTAVDPFSRRSIRASMGNCFRMPIIQSKNLPAELDRLKTACGYETIGMSLCETALSITEINFSPKTILLVGNEATGLSPVFESLCDRQTIIDMADGIDSLNVAAAAAIAMFTFQQSNSSN